MGKGGYTGGSTIIGPRSGWFSKPREKSERGQPVGESRFMAEVMGLATPQDVKARRKLVRAERAAQQAKKLVFQAGLKAKRAADAAARKRKKTVLMSAPAKPKEAAVKATKNGRNPRHQQTHRGTKSMLLATTEPEPEVERSSARPRKPLLSLRTAR